MNTSSSLNFRPIRRVHFDSPLFSLRKLSTPSSPSSSLISPDAFSKISQSASTDFAFNNVAYLKNDLNFSKRSLSLDSIFLLSTRKNSLNDRKNSKFETNSIAAQFFNAMFTIPWNSTAPLTFKDDFKKHGKFDVKRV